LPVEKHIEWRNRGGIRQEASGPRLARGLLVASAANSEVSEVTLVRSWYRRFNEYMPAANNDRPEPKRGVLRTAESTLGLLVALDLISRRDPAVTPRLSQIVGKTRIPSSRRLCLAARRLIRCPILRVVPDPSLFGDNREL
jgi:hypothetical protein